MTHPPLKAALIADDLTGANNTAVLLAKRGIAVTVVTLADPAFPATCEAVAIDTDSRYVAPEEARRRVRDAARWARSNGAELLCDRVDNLLRGNIGAEIAGVLDALAPDAVAVVAPAFPALRRAVSNGCLLVEGRPVNENPIAANDPFLRVRHARIADIVAEQWDEAVAEIGLAAVLKGEAAVADAMARAAQAGARAVVVDAETDAHLETVARAMTRLTRPTVPVDPGPLSAAYVRLHGGADALPKDAGPGPTGKKIVVTVGSVTDLSHRQVAHLIAARKLDPVRLSARALLDDGKIRVAVIANAVNECRARLGTTDVVLLTTHSPDGVKLAVDALAAMEGSTPHALSKRISDGLADAVLRTIESFHGAVGGAFVSGGDVTASLSRLSGAKAIDVFGDVIPLTAHVRFSGGRLDGLRLVTKGGSIGGDDAMEVCLAHLERDLRLANL